MQRAMTGLGLVLSAGLMLGATPDGSRRSRSYRYHETFFSLADANGDGKLTPEELRAGLRRLRQADANGDGAIDRDEWADVQGAMQLARTFLYLDRDGDGRLSSQEFRYGSTQFQLADVNRDKAVSAQEYGQWHRNRMAAYRLARADRLMAMDADGDGQVSVQECRYGRRYHRYYDTDGDGYITRAEAAQPPSYRRYYSSSGESSSSASPTTQPAPQTVPRPTTPPVEGVPRVEP